MYENGKAQGQQNQLKKKRRVYVMHVRSKCAPPPWTRADKRSASFLSQIWRRQIKVPEHVEVFVYRQTPEWDSSQKASLFLKPDLWRPIQIKVLKMVLLFYLLPMYIYLFSLVSPRLCYTAVLPGLRRSHCASDAAELLHKVQFKGTVGHLANAVWSIDKHKATASSCSAQLSTETPALPRQSPAQNNQFHHHQHYWASEVPTVDCVTSGQSQAAVPAPDWGESSNNLLI